jgi:hypothetical protein
MHKMTDGVRQYYKSVPLQVPPKRWRNSASLQALAGYMRAELVRYELKPEQHSVQIGSTQARSIIEALCQAIHMERGLE